MKELVGLNYDTDFCDTSARILSNHCGLHLLHLNTRVLWFDQSDHDVCEALETLTSACNYQNSITSPMFYTYLFKEDLN